MESLLVEGKNGLEFYSVDLEIRARRVTCSLAPSELKGLFLSLPTLTFSKSKAIKLRYSFPFFLLPLLPPALTLAEITTTSTWKCPPNKPDTRQQHRSLPPLP